MFPFCASPLQRHAARMLHERWPLRPATSVNAGGAQFADGVRSKSATSRVRPSGHDRPRIFLARIRLFDGDDQDRGPHVIDRIRDERVMSLAHESIADCVMQIVRIEGRRPLLFASGEQ